MYLLLYIELEMCTSTCSFVKKRRKLDFYLIYYIYSIIDVQISKSKDL